jgi:DNA ligase (NAD+)
MAAPDYFRIPEYCPACSGILSVEGQFLFCRNRSCPIQLSGSVKVWVKRLGLLHWGDALIDALTDPDKPKIASLADLYKLEPEEIAECTSGLKMAKKCWETLHSNKSIKLELLIASLNIPNLAVATATNIVQAGYDSVDKVLALTQEQLLRVPDIGPVTAQQVFDGLQERKCAILDLAAVLNVRGPEAGSLSGKSFCITGATSKPRKAVQKMIMDAGGIVKDSVGNGLSYLVTNETDTTSKKMQNAKKYGTEVISESRLYEMMGEDSKTLV